MQEKLDSSENCIGLIRKVSPIPLILKGYDLCIGDTFEAAIHFLAVDRTYSIGNLNIGDSSIQIFSKDGTLIGPKDVLEIEKGKSLPLKIQCKISSIAASHQQESKVRSASYFSPRNVGAGLFFDLEYQVSSGGRDRNEGFGQISVTIYNNLAGRLSDGQGKIELRRSDCINSEGLFLMFDASYGQSSVHVQVFEGDVLRKEKFIHINDTMNVDNF